MLKSNLILVREYHRDAAAMDALIQLVCPWRCARRNQAKVRIALDLEVVWYKATSERFFDSQETMVTPPRKPSTS